MSHPAVVFVVADSLKLVGCTVSRMIRALVVVFRFDGNNNNKEPNV